jgi:hypothetical protein
MKFFNEMSDDQLLKKDAAPWTYYYLEPTEMNSLYLTNKLTEQLYKLTPWNRIHLEKLTVTQLVTKSLAFYGTRRFSTVFITAHHWSLS